MDRDVVKVLRTSIHDAQLRVINEGLQQMELHNKKSFRDLCQLLVSAAVQTGTNFNVDDFLLKPHRLAEINQEQFKMIFQTMKPLAKRAAKRKCLNFQVDLWDKHSVSMLGLSGSY